jgi:hypothetical protein
MPIQPYRSVGPIELGSTASSVAQAVGPPRESSKTASGLATELRDGLRVNYTADGRVFEVVLWAPSRPVLDGWDIFAEPERFTQVIESVGQVYECLGMLVLMDLGVALEGFHDEGSELTVVVFDRGRFDPYRHRFSPYPAGASRS